MVAASTVWATALRQLAELPSTSERTITLQVALNPLPAFNKLLVLPTINPAEWNPLVTDLKVPLKLGQAAAASAASDPLAPRTYAAIRAVSTLLEACSDGAARVGQNLSSLTRSVGQQLKQSGLLAALPQLLEAAAVALDASAHAPDLSDIAQTLCSVISRRYRVGSQPHTQGEAVDQNVLEVVRTHLAAVWLLVLVNQCQCTWPHHLDRAAICVPALRLCAAAFQHCSRCADALPAAAAAPTALEELMGAAFAAAHTLCVDYESQQLAGLNPPELRSPHALRAFCMLLLMATVAPAAGDSSGEAAQRSATNAVTAAPCCDVDYGSQLIHLPDCWSQASLAASQVAWQAACARESSLSTAQQQTLRELGCSGRAFLWGAGHALAPLMPLGSGPTPYYYSVCCMLMHGSNHPTKLQDSPTLDQPKQVAGALSQLQPADSPPFGSPLLPCAALLWLMPAVLLEWALGQPADKPDLAVLLVNSGHMLGCCMFQVVAQQQFWRHVEILLAQATDAAGQLEGDQASLAAVGSPPLGLGGQPPDQTEASMFLPAARAAGRFCACWVPPADCLALLLQLSSSTAARILACIRDAPAGPSSSSCSSSENAGCDEPGFEGTSTPPFTASLQRLSNSQASLMQLCNICLEDVAFTSIQHAAAGSADMQDSTPGVIYGWTGAADDALASLCAALQQTLPQLAGLVEAALRCQAGDSQGCIDDMRDTLCAFRVFLHWACAPACFLAVRLQPGSPALRALCGVVLTVVKLAGMVLGGGGLAGVDSTAAVGCMQRAMDVASLVLQAAFTTAATSSSSAGDSAGSSRGSTSSSSSSNNSDAVITALLSSSIWSNYNAASLSKLASVAATGSTTTSLGPGAAAVEVVPWLVVFGRCCLLHAAALQQTPQAVGPNTAQYRDEVVRDVSRVLPDWLQSHSVSAQLSALGHDTARLLELLQQAPQAQQKASAVDRAQQLQDLGLALTSLPFETGCNNPGCTALDGLSEQQLVVGTARLCGGCRVARYCCRACQVAAWKLHKPACKATAAARAADNPAVVLY